MPNLGWWWLPVLLIVAPLACIGLAAVIIAVAGIGEEPEHWYFDPDR